MSVCVCFLFVFVACKRISFSRSFSFEMAKLYGERPLKQNEIGPSSLGTTSFPGTGSGWNGIKHISLKGARARHLTPQFQTKGARVSATGN